MHYTTVMTEILVLFIDSLPFFKRHEMRKLALFTEQWPIDPGFGYSINIHAELFAGTRPDELGYFGEWTYDPENSPGRHLKPLLPILDRIFKPYLLNRGIQRVLTLPFSGRSPMPNIRIRDLHLFARQGRHILSGDFPVKTIFQQFPDIEVINYREIGQKKGERDAAIFETAMQKVTEHKRLFVPFPDLDHTGHQYGVDHPAYLQHLAELDGWCAGLAARFFESHPQGHVFIVSDHGMSNVTRGVHLDIEKRFGQPSENSYHYFSDANLLRIWVFLEDYRQPIADYLEELGWGRLLSDAERRAYGLTSPTFGTFIYALDEGLAFQPSTFAHNIPRGMHGYHPQDLHQKAVLFHAGPTWRGKPPIRMSDVYAMLLDAFTDAW